MRSGGTHWWKPGQRVTRRPGAEARVSCGASGVSSGKRRTSGRGLGLGPRRQVIWRPGLVSVFILQRWGRAGAGAHVAGRPLSSRRSPVAQISMVSIFKWSPGPILIPSNVNNKVSITLVSRVALMSRLAEVGFHFHFLGSDFVIWCG